VENRVIRKPSILFTSQEIVDAIKVFRKHFGWTKKNFKSRRQEGAKIGTKLVRPIMSNAFSKSFKHAKAFGWSVSSHHCRKICSQAAAKIYENQLRKVTGGQYIDKSVFVSKLLGHQVINCFLSLTLISIPCLFTGFLPNGDVVCEC
jgi:hypothetical protein